MPASKTTSKATKKTALKTALKTVSKPAVKKAVKTTAKPAAKPTATVAKKAVTKAPAKKAPAVKTVAAKKPISSPAMKAAPAKPARAAKSTAPQTGERTTLRGRSVFVVQTTNAGVVVRSAWLSEDKKLQEMPAVFPNVDYAVNVLDDLKRQVLKHFDRAAQVGVRAMADQAKAQKT